jgi:hypothetical protein
MTLDTRNLPRTGLKHSRSVVSIPRRRVRDRVAPLYSSVYTARAAPPRRGCRLAMLRPTKPSATKYNQVQPSPGQFRRCPEPLASIRGAEGAFASIRGHSAESIAWPEVGSLRASPTGQLVHTVWYQPLSSRRRWSDIDLVSCCWLTISYRQS